MCALLDDIPPISVRKAMDTKQLEMRLGQEPSVVSHVLQQVCCCTYPVPT
jgi:hypothetical protein